MADNIRVSEVDFRIIARELGYETVWIEREIKTLQQENMLSWDIRRRLIPPHMLVYYMPRPARETYQAELRKLEKHPEPEKRDLSNELKELAATITDSQEMSFLDETMKCLDVSANRAAIVMGWNLAYHHVRSWILAKHLAAFNAELTSRNRSKSKTYDPVSCHDDFPDGESFVLEICRAAGFLDKHRCGVLEGALKKRNRYAHPSPASATGAEATGHVAELLENVLLDPYFG